MTRYASRFALALHLPDLLRPNLYLARILAVGLIAIGMSGGVCQVVGWQMGDHALAADSESTYLSAARCADLAEYYPAKTCAAAEMAHHADEIVRNRVAAGVLGVLALAGYLLLRRKLRLDDEERREQARRYALLAIAAFSLAAALLLGIGTGVTLGSGDAAPRWFADGAVAAAFALVHIALLRPGSFGIDTVRSSS